MRFSDVQIEIADYLTPFCGDNERLNELLTISVGRVLLNAANKSHPWRNLTSTAEISHIRDWLEASIMNEEPWLKIQDTKGRPKKLLKFSTVADITKEANKAMLKAAQKLRDVQTTEDDEQVIANLEDGFFVVRLLSPSALDRESGEMQHCIGNGGYDLRVLSDDFQYFSLRDSNGKRHVTMEVSDNKLIQFQGKQNNPPLAKYTAVLKPFLQQRKFGIDVPASTLGHVVDIHNVWHAIGKLPDGLHVAGNLDLSGLNFETLPARLIVDKDLSLVGSTIQTIPADMIVRGCLNLREAIIGKFESSFTADYGIDLSKAQITSLPDNMHVNDFLNLSSCSIKTLPEGLHVEGWLDINNTEINFLPERMTVKGYFDLGTIQIAHLPETISDETTIYFCDIRYKARDFRRELQENTITQEVRFG